MNTFVDAVINEMNEAPARTENNMKARATTASPVLNYFSKAGTSRGRKLTTEFTAALVGDPDLAIRALLWTRDVRGGAGERQQFRDMLHVLEQHNWAMAGHLIPKIIEVGRWDDLFAFTAAPNVQTVVETFAQALRENNALAAKWTPRRNKWFHLIRNHMNLSPRAFRKLIVGLTNVVESDMSAKNWNSIDFSKVPSLAAARYQKAFERNAPVEYAKYLGNIMTGEAKINAAAVYPYDVIKSVKNGVEQAADAQWNALPDYLDGKRVFPIVDTSGSMHQPAGNNRNVDAIDVSISLGLYVADKNKSVFKDLLLIFSQESKMVKVEGTISQKVRMLPTIHDMNTDLHKAFEKILNVATSNRVPASDMPEVLLILSDMQFDECLEYDDSALEMIRRKYGSAGYQMPKIVFWNISGRRSGWYGGGEVDNYPVRFDERGTALVSGFSPAILKAVLSDNLEEFTPEAVMMETLMNPRYDWN